MQPLIENILEFFEVFETVQKNMPPTPRLLPGRGKAKK